LSIYFEESLSRAHGNFEEPNKFLHSSTITVFFIIKTYYNYTKNAYNYYISNIELLEECYEEVKVEVTGAVATWCLKGRS